MKTITVSLSDSVDETVEAAYFQIEDHWITFKTEDHKAVASYPEARVTRIKSEAPAAHTIDLNVSPVHAAANLKAETSAQLATGLNYGLRLT